MEKTTTVQDNTAVIDAKSVWKQLYKILAGNMKTGNQPTVIILNMHKSRVLNDKKGANDYAYSYDGGRPTQMWITEDNFIVCVKSVLNCLTS